MNSTVRFNGLNNALRQRSGAISNRFSALPIIILPRKLHESIKRNRLNIVDLVNNFSTIRKFVSFRDLAEFLFVNKATISGRGISTFFSPTGIFENLTEEQKFEVENHILPLSESVEISNVYEMAERCSDNTYEFIVVNEFLFIVIKDDFFEALKNIDFRDEFIRSYVKHCYGMVAINDVSSLPLFNLYVQSV